jgi:hypothetical protein
LLLDREISGETFRQKDLSVRYADLIENSMDYLAIIGAVAFSIGWVWLTITGFQKGNIIWGILILLFHSAAGLIFCIVKKTGFLQYGVMLAGMILLVIGLNFK